MSSGVGVDDVAVTTFNGFKLQTDGYKFRYLTYKIQGDTIILDKTGAREEGYDEFAKALSAEPNDCRYGVVDLDFTTKDGRPTSKLVFVSWSPDSSTIKNKMLYSSSKEALKRVLVGVGIFLNATDASELEYAAIHDGVSKFL
ncbi:Aste57867_23050 [Aphanomyces stellatus]|uniref:Aste57867_23050 protein n=1 Tax=Aphanomyces stellatus TaxID=120398 RepID=A0A485LLU6_9STRA|nr:hypothetical protein As57867_022979 [Aphanomyces stellatus]VFT99698.1 Aste57867_23050 [Aphanomyces stellatus]